MSDLLDEIVDEISARRRELAPLVAEYVRLVAADQALTAEFGPLRRTREPRLRVVHGVDEPVHLPDPEHVTLRVQTVGAPSEREMIDREVAHVTQEPA